MGLPVVEESVPMGLEVLQDAVEAVETTSRRVRSALFRADTLSIFALMAFGIYLLRTVKYPVAGPKQSPPSQEDNVDLSRWRHDGEQPLGWKRGNGEFNEDIPSKVLSDML